MKLGEALIEADLLTENQLKEALDRQGVFGGRIDTNLVELRFIDDAKLACFLGKFLNLPSANPDMVNAIPAEVIQTLSKETVAKYKVLPLKLDRHTLHIAMRNPRDIKIIDDLRFITGFEIIPYVITELRLVNAFEKYYGIKKALRYISLEDRFSTGTEITDVDIERAESKFAQQKLADAKSETSPPFTSGISSIEIGTYDLRDKAGLIGAFLTNAFYAAKLSFFQQGEKYTDSQIEDKVIAQWSRLARRILNSENDK